MRKHLLSSALISRIEGSCLRWLIAHNGSGLSCCLLVIGGLYGLSLGVGVKGLSLLPPLWDAVFWSLGEVAAALLGAAIGQFALLSLAAYSPFIRRVLSTLVVILADIPSFCLLGVAFALLPPFWSVAGVAAFSLIARGLYATLKTGREIPVEFLKTARALRLSYGQAFWRLHVPFAFPELVQSVLLNLPDFWLCLLGGEFLIAFCRPQWHAGLGAFFHDALMEHNVTAACMAAVLMLGLIGLVQHGLITPLLGHGKRYAVCDLETFKKGKAESRLMVKWREYLIMSQLTILLITSIALTYIAWPWSVGTFAFMGPLSYLLAAVCIILLFWGVVGGWVLGVSQTSQRVISHICFALALCPLFVIFPYLGSITSVIFLPALTSLSIVGWNIACKVQQDSVRQLFLMGKQLRLPTFPLWRDVRLPLLYPILLDAIIIALPFFWDNLYLTAFLGEKQRLPTPTSTFYVMLQGHHYGQEFLFLILMTALALSIRWGVCVPLQERVTRRYGI